MQATELRSSENKDKMSVVDFFAAAMLSMLTPQEAKDNLHGFFSEKDVTQTIFLINPLLTEDNIDQIVSPVMTRGNNLIKAWHIRKGELYQETPATTLAVTGFTDIIFANWMPLKECPPADPQKNWVFRRYQVVQETRDTDPKLKLFRDSRIHETYRDPMLWPTQQSNPATR
jgi:hypothetical protein